MFDKTSHISNNNKITGQVGYYLRKEGSEEWINDFVNSIILYDMYVTHNNV